jgi:hypothetical protein
VPQLSRARPELQQTYDHVIESAMAKNRDDRFSTGNDLFNALEKAMLEAGSAISMENQATIPHPPMAYPQKDQRPSTPPPVVRPASSVAPARPATPPPQSKSSSNVARPATPLPQSRPLSQPAMPKVRRGVPVWTWGIIGVLGLGLLCGILFLGWIFFSEISAPLPTATLLAAQPPPSTPTETSIIESDTPAAPTAVEPSEEPANAPYDPTIGLESGDEIIFDDFSDSDSGWPTYNGVDGYARYQADAYRIYVDLPNDRLEMTRGFDIADVYLEATASKVGGADDNLMGLVCRYQDRNNFYFFIISSDGYYGVGKVVGGVYQLVDGKMLPSQVIKKGASTNNLEATCDGSSFDFWVNGTELASFEDETFQSGDIGMMAGTYTISGTDTLFDDFGAYLP